MFEESTVANDRDEYRSALRHDPGSYKRIGGQLYDVADVPTLADLRGDDWGDE